MVGAPSLGPELGVGQGIFLFATVLALPLAMSKLAEPWIHAWSDTVDTRRLLRASLLGSGGCLTLAAFAPSAVALSGCLGAWSLCTGVACGLAQAGLVRCHTSPERALTRWAIATSLGDIAAPLFVVTLSALGFSWRAALVAAALPSFAISLVTWNAPIARPPEDHDQNMPPTEVRSVLFARPRLWAWLAATAACALLDEILLMLAALRLEPNSASFAAQLGALVVGDAVGLFLMERRLDRISTPHTLTVSAALSAGCLAAWVATDDPRLGALFLFGLGASAAVQWPLAKASAFACVPERPGLINALESALDVADIIAPLALGMVLSAWGVEAAILTLLLQPLTVGTVALLFGREPIS
ncbi:MAG: hypothetical protein ACFB9M_16190 [Myxococcota bacterium]